MHCSTSPLISLFNLLGVAACVLHCCSDNELSGPAAQLKGKKLLGFLVGRTLTNRPSRVEEPVRERQRFGYGILLSSGRSLALDNSTIVWKTLP
jgi:hypothetical protein